MGYVVIGRTDLDGMYFLCEKGVAAMDGYCKFVELFASRDDALAGLRMAAGHASKNWAKDLTVRWEIHEAENNMARYWKKSDIGYRFERGRGLVKIQHFFDAAGVIRDVRGIPV